MSGVTQTAQRDIPAARAPLPPFTRETAIQKVRLIEDAWNLREPEKMALAYTVGQGTGLSLDQGAVGLRGKSHRGTLCISVAR